MLKVHPFSVVVGIGIGLAINVNWVGISDEGDAHNSTHINDAPGTVPGTESPLPRLLVTPWKEEKTTENTAYDDDANEKEGVPPLAPPIKQYNEVNRLLQARETVKNAMYGTGLTVHSDFITELEMLHRLANPDLWTRCANRPSHTKDWMDRDAIPNGIWEHLVVQIWKDHPIVTSGQKFQGYEYWCNILTPKSNLAWHIDKDEHYMEAMDGYITPMIGSVYYGFPHRFTGGYLEVLPYDYMESPDAQSIYHHRNITISTNVQRFEAIYNRMITFNVSKWHRVSPIYSGFRVTFAVNIWKTKPLIQFVPPPPLGSKSDIVKSHTREEADKQQPDIPI